MCLRANTGRHQSSPTLTSPALSIVLRWRQCFLSTHQDRDGPCYASVTVCHGFDRLSFSTTCRYWIPKLTVSRDSSSQLLRHLPWSLGLLLKHLASVILLNASPWNEFSWRLSAARTKTAKQSRKEEKYEPTRDSCITQYSPAKISFSLDLTLRVFGSLGLKSCLVLFISIDTMPVSTALIDTFCCKYILAADPRFAFSGQNPTNTTRQCYTDFFINRSYNSASAFLDSSRLCTPECSV